MAIRRKKGDTIQLFLENQDTVSPPWSLKDNEQIVPRKKRVRIKRLAHTTHSSSHKSICVSVVKNRFKFNKVSGKGRDARDNSLQCTYKQSQDSDKLRLVRANTELLPGYYSWWEVDFEPADRVKLIGDIIDEYGSQTARQSEVQAHSKLQLSNLKKIAYEQHFVNLPSYIKGEGFHGPHKFSSNLSTLIKRYKEAREAQEGKSHGIILRFAGTLRYKYQVSSAVIICSDADAQLECYETLDKIHRFSIDHMLDQNSRVCGSSDHQYIEFDSESVVTKRLTDYCMSFWHQAVFLFFSPSEDLTLEVSDGKWSKVWHPICATYGKGCKERCSYA